MLACPCLLLMGLLAHAFPIYTTQTHAATSAWPDLSHATPLDPLLLDAPLSWSVEGPSLLEPDLAGSRLEYLTITGTQHSTGLDPELNECHFTAEGGSCAAVDDGLLDFTLAWSSEQPIGS
jgi:hypothetical protein